MATIPETGLIAIATALARSNYWYVEIGTSSTAENVNQTALVTPITSDGMGRTVAPAAYEATAKTAITATMGAASGALTTIREVAVLDAASGGNMLIRHVWGSNKSVAIGDSLVIPFKITAARPA